MKKYFWSMLALAMVTMLSVGFVSCGDDDDDADPVLVASGLVGSWQQVPEGYPHEEIETWTFKSNGTGTITCQANEDGKWRTVHGTKKIKWSVEEDMLTIHWGEEDDYDIETTNYSIEDKTLYMFGMTLRKK